MGPLSEGLFIRSVSLTSLDAALGAWPLRPTRLALPSFASSPRSESLPRVATSPGCPRVLPDSYLCQSFPSCPVPCPDGPPSARTCFFPDVIGLPQDSMGRLAFRQWERNLKPCLLARLVFAIPNTQIPEFNFEFWSLLSE